MEENEIQENGITVGDIFRTIFSQKWLALILAAAILIIGTVGLYFYNKIKAVYSVTFVLQLPDTGDASATSYTYPDGESFYFTDIISYNNLKTVSDDARYESVDVDKMVKNGDIAIVRALDEVSSVSSSVEVYDLVYTISVKAKYFSSEEAATEFIVALTEIPGQYIANMDISYDQNLTASKSALTYDIQLTQLRNQLTYIQAKYASFVNTYGGEFILSDGRTLATCKSEIDKYISEDIFGTLKTEALKNGYIKSADSASGERAKYEADLYNKQLELEVETKALEMYIDTLKNSGSTIISDEQIINRQLKIATINQEMEILQRYIDSFDISGKAANAEFEAKIAKVEQDVTKFTDEIKPIASYLYGKVTKVNYTSSGIIEVEKGMGLLMSAVISLVVGIVVAAVVAYIVGWNKKNKKVKSAVVLPVYAEAQAQAAVTDAENAEENNKDNDK